LQSSLQILENLNILYAEDDPHIRENLVPTLSMIFGNVYAASNGSEALKIYHQKKIDVVLLDYVMPFMSGYDVAKEIRNNDKYIPIIISSAFTDKEKLLNAIELNLVKYLEKPIIYDDLKKVFLSTITSLQENNRLNVKLDDNLSYSYVTKIVTSVDGKEMQLTKNEIYFLELLLTKRTQLFTKAVIENEIFKEAIDENTMRNLVYRLRKKLGTEAIVTIKDLGYLMK
jgi:DNA-binding response OmpR family regulator